MNRYAQIDDAGICFATGTGNVPGSILIGNIDRLGQRYDGAEWHEVAPPAAPRAFSGTNFLELLGGTVNKQLIVSLDPEVMVINKMFDTVAGAGKDILVTHPAAEIAFSYLLQSQEISAFDIAKYNEVMGP